MIVNETRLHGVKLITPEKFEDHRGSYVELYDSKKFNSNVHEVNFVQDDISVSRKRKEGK